MPVKVVVLNGVGSAGKSSIARALQQITEAPFLHVEMDAFLGMLPERYEAREQGRGNRHRGLARWQFNRVHRGMTYDLEVDSAQQSTADCARSIKHHFGL